MANFNFVAAGVFRSGTARNADDSTIGSLPVWGYNASLQVFNGDSLDDSITGTSGNDAIFYDFYSSRDTLWQRINGIETINAGSGNDIVDLTSSKHADYATAVTINGENGKDHIWSGAGNDILHGGADADTLWGGAGNDKLYGGTGNDMSYGFTGDDTLECDSGSNRLSGGAGHDVFLVQPGTPGASAVSFIEDFSAGGSEDVVDLSGFALDFAGVQSRLSINLSTGNVQLNLNGFPNPLLDSGTIQFGGIAATTDLTIGDFIFV